MPKHSDYIRIPQQEDRDGIEDGGGRDSLEEDDDNEIGESSSAIHMRSPSASSASQAVAGPSGNGGPKQPSYRRPTKAPRRISGGKIDLSSLDNAFKRWTQEISQKVRRKKKTLDEETRKEIVYSVFQRVAPPTIVSVRHVSPSRIGSMRLIRHV